MTEALKNKENLKEQEKLRNDTTRGLSNLRQDVVKTNKEKTKEKKEEAIQACINHLRLVVDDKYYEDVMEKNTEATIMSIQYLLKSKGYDCGEVDGILVTKGKKTSKTMEAIKKFQEDAGLKVDGIPGKETINTLLMMYHNIQKGLIYNAEKGKESIENVFDFRKKRSISDQQAELLSKFKNLGLNGLASLSDKQAELLGSGKIEYLDLSGLRSITNKQAESLSKIKKISLSGLKSLSNEQAEILSSGEIEQLYLNGLTSLSDKQAESLSNVKYLELNGLTSITDKQAEELAKVSHLYIDEDILTQKQKEILGK